MTATHLPRPVRRLASLAPLLAALPLCGQAHAGSSPVASATDETHVTRAGQATDSLQTLELAGVPHGESIVRHGNDWFVSNLGDQLKPDAEDGDGFISQLDTNGRVVRLHAFPAPGDGKLNAPKGMAVVGNRLYVADIHRVVGFDVDQGRQVFEATAPESDSMLNDIAEEDPGQLIVTDTAGNAVYRLKLESGAFEKLTGDIPAPNGVVLDSTRRTAYVAGYKDGNVYSLNLNGPPRVHQVAEVGGQLDGIQMMDGGELIVSEWGHDGQPGSLHVVTTAGKRLRDIPLPAGATGPADMYLDSRTNRLWIPLLPQGKLVTLAIPGTRKIAMDE